MVSSDLADALAALRSRPKTGTLRSRGVGGSAELTRILALPRRVETDEALEELARLTTLALRRPGGEMSLWPQQAALLRDLHDFGGAVGIIGCGGGKTPVSYLAPVVVGAERPLLLIPAHLREKTRRDFERLAEHWYGPERYEVRSYQELADVRYGQWFEDYAPDLVVGDESQHLNNRSAAVTRRLARYLQAHPEVPLLCMSGTLFERSLMASAHLAERCLGPLCPVPIRYGDLSNWDLATMEKLPPRQSRMPPGALIRLYDASETELSRTDPVAAARAAVGRRVRETPGVVSTGGGGFQGALTVWVRVRPCSPPQLEALARLRSAWELPDGTELSQAPDVWRHARTLGLGYFDVWGPPAPPDEWRDARREWARECRRILTRNRSGIDTEEALVEALVFETYEDEAAFEALNRWKTVEPSYKVRTSAVWVDEGVPETIAMRSRELDGDALVWVGHRGLAEQLERVMPYYGREGLRANGESILDCPGGTIALSVRANSSGQNLQDRWSRNYVPCPPPHGTTWEQMISRTHRPGQESDEVVVLVELAVEEDRTTFEQAVRDAEYASRLTGERTRLSRATLIMPSARELRDLP